MDIQSEYYNSYELNTQKYDIPEEAMPYGLEAFQGSEEEMFSFAMFLLM